ncbi:MAG: PAS domain S-box protein [bacterium]
MIEALYRRLMDFTRDGVYQYRFDDGRILLANQGFVDILDLNCTPEELVGKCLKDVLIYTDKEGSVRQALEHKGEIHGFEYHFKTLKGEDRWVIHDSRIVNDPDTKQRIVEAIVKDITERTKAEQQLAAEEERLRVTLHSIGDGVITTDTTGNIVLINSVAEQLTGWPQEEAMGRPLPEIFQIINEKTRQLCVNPVEKVLQSGTIVGLANHTALIARDGTERSIADSGAPIREPGGNIIGVVLVFRDVTGVKQAEAEHARLQAQLTQAQKMESVGRLAGGVAHDFNNMLMGTMGYADLCRDELPAGHPIRCYLDEITNISWRSANLTRQLLAFARKTIIAPQILDLNNAMSGMLQLLQRLLGENIQMVYLPGANLWPVKLDPSQLDQILTNICVNARDAIDGVGKIIVETATATLDQAYCDDHAGAVPGEYVLLSVSDTGCGMTKDVLANIFEPFFTTKEVGKGTGLGLATVYGIIKQNNGYIDVYSEPGKGTAFKIYMPRFGGEVAKPNVAKIVEAPRGRGETILLVEDEPALLKTFGRCLVSLGYEVLLAANPAEALDIVARHSGVIHLLFTDVIMPGMNGRELAEQLQASKPGLKVLFMSGYTAEGIDEKELLQKSVSFIQKPATRGDIARKVREVLDV